MLDKIDTTCYGVYMHVQRYQLYLSPRTVSIIDEVKTLSNISRSKQMRAVLERYVDLVAKTVLAPNKPTPKKMYANLDKLVGIIKGNPKKKTNYALDDDSIYLRD